MTAQVFDFDAWCQRARRSTVLTCHHEDNDGNLVAYDTALDEAEYGHGAYSWACPYGEFHEAEEGEIG